MPQQQRPTRERRNGEAPRGASLREQLNESQRVELATLEHFGWELKFIRKPLFDVAVPVVFDRETHRHAVLNKDGSLDENPDFNIRH